MDGRAFSPQLSEEATKSKALAHHNELLTDASKQLRLELNSIRTSQYDKVVAAEANKDEVIRGHRLPASPIMLAIGRDGSEAAAVLG